MNSLKTSANTALIPSSFVPFAAQSLEEPVPYSFPAMTTKSIFFYIPWQPHKHSLLCHQDGVVNPPSVPGAISFPILILPKVPRIITSWFPLLAPYELKSLLNLVPIK